MSPLLVTLLLAPTLVASASLLARKYGGAIAGWLAGFPFIVGPVLWLLTAQYGVGPGVIASRAGLVGLLSLISFCIVHAWASRRFPWWKATGLGFLGYLASIPLFGFLRVSSGLSVGIAVAGIVLGLRLLPRESSALRRSSVLPWWDIPLRVVMTLFIVTLVRTIAAWAGPEWGGVFSPFPASTAVLSGFAHAQSGSDEVARFHRGLLPGLLSLVGFFFTLAVTLEHLPTPLVFACGIASALVANSIVLWTVSRRSLPARGALDLPAAEL